MDHSDLVPKPTIIFEVPMVLCNRHGEPFRVNWPKGYPSFMLKAWDIVVAQKAFGEEVGEKLEPVVVSQVLKKRPLCCRLKPDELRRLYIDINLGKVAHCETCHKRRIGTMCRINSHGGLGHVCFECVVYRAE